MRDLNQQIIKFDYDQNYEKEDFFISNNLQNIFSSQWA